MALKQAREGACIGMPGSLDAHAKDDPLAIPPPPLPQADRDQLFAAVSYTKVQMAAMMPLVTGIYQQTVQASMQVGFGSLGLSVSHERVTGIYQQTVQASMQVGFGSLGLSVSHERVTAIYQQTVQTAMQVVGLMRGRGRRGVQCCKYQVWDVALIHTAPPPSSTLPMMLHPPRTGLGVRRGHVRSGAVGGPVEGHPGLPEQDRCGEPGSSVK